MENIEKRMTILDFINQPFISLRTKNSLIFINEHYTYMDELSVVKLGKFRKVGIQTIFEIQKYYPNLKNELQVISNYEIGKYLKRNRKYKPTNTPQEKAKQLVDKFGYFAVQESWQNKNYYAIECALIAVDEILESHNKFLSGNNTLIYKYYQEVKSEIELL